MKIVNWLECLVCELASTGKTHPHKTKQRVVCVCRSLVHGHGSECAMDYPYGVELVQIAVIVSHFFPHAESSLKDSREHSEAIESENSQLHGE